MTLRDIWTAAFHRPWLALAVAALCGLWSFHQVTAPTVYETRAVVTLLSPKTTFPRNAYAGFTQGLVMLTEASALSAANPATRDQIRRAGGTGDYAVVMANRGNEELPIHDQPDLWVSARSTDPAEAERTLTAAMGVLRTQLRERQESAGASTASLVTWRVTGGNGAPVALHGSRIRQLAGLGLISILVTTYTVVLADRRSRWFPRSLRSVLRFGSPRPVRLPHRSGYK
ncbi:hypothetical protein [Actinopolymorpha rutila]|uniref:Capsular polysaccharide biosynthesis protein n=1 Tax=Actinopolymorpha rutila TaxID=446787 RepID=A0A852ZTX8_9ACTN|nr:hypothetical protein [Actinopolymorpha rutila]NYH92116.1 hypothetical protein [Actinopolymorpha rutila]